MKKLIILVLLAVVSVVAGCSKDPGGTFPQTDGTENRGGTDTSMIPVYETEYEIGVDFSERDYSRTPYLKKFDMFAATWAWCNDYSANPVLTQKNLEKIPDVALLNPETIRTDLFMGYYGIGRKIGANGGSGSSEEEFALVKRLLSEYEKNGLSAEFVYFASPEYTGGGIDGDGWKKVTDLKKWENLCFNIADYFRKNDLPVLKHEIWNEPDYIGGDGKGVFFNGSWQDYIDLYIAGAKGVRNADPDALIGGVSAAWIIDTYKNGNYSRLLEQSLAAGVLPDYVSWHFYGCNGGMRMLEQYISSARAGLEKSAGYSTVQQCLNEFNIDLDTKVIKSYSMVQPTFEAIEQLLDATDITRVTWTSALDRTNDDAAALIDPVSGERRPAYYVHWMYSRLPVAAAVTESKTNKVGIMSAVGDTRCGIILYDRAKDDTDVTLHLNGIPFDSFDIAVYTVDGENPPARISSDIPTCILKAEKQKELSDYSVKIPKNGAIYVEINKSGAENDVHERKSPLAENVARTDYWYNGRDDGGAYALFSTRSMTVSIGSGTSEKSDGIACFATLDGMKGKTLDISAVISGNMKAGKNDAMFGITVDYSDGNGYSKKVYFAIDGVGTSAAIPLGTGKAPDKTVGISFENGSAPIDLGEYAPENWDGRIMLGFVCSGMSKSGGAEFVIN